VTTISVKRGFTSENLEQDMKEILSALEKIREILGEKWEVSLEK
jgi:hypothetical protein